MPILLYLLLSLSLSTYPATQAQQPVLYFNQAFTLQQHSQVILTDSAAEHRVVISLGNVLDSRCPSDVLCIQAGSAEVNLSMSALNGESAVVTLGIGGNKIVKPQPVKVNQIQLAGATYTITVLDVTPYPTATGPQFSKNARLIVAKL